jgi:L-iduronidase
MQKSQLKLILLLLLFSSKAFPGDQSFCKRSEIQLPETINFIINAEQTKPFHHFWKSTGFSPSNLLLNKDMQQLMAYAGSIPNNGITFVRIHYLLELVEIKGFATENQHYNWQILDKSLDMLIRNNLKPFFELMGFPTGLQVDFENDAHLKAWKQFVYDLASHYEKRYGREEIRSWYFETWNEPDLSFWKQSDQAFMNYYDACSEGLREADSHLVFGGPGTAGVLSQRFKNLLAHCDTGRNYFTGEKGVRLDFISVHVKGARKHHEDLIPDSKLIIEQESRITDYIREKHPGFAKLPFMNNECDPQVGWDLTHSWRGMPYYAAIAAKIINQHQTALVNSKGIEYTILSNDNGFLGSWGHRSLLARFGKVEDLDIGQAADRTSLLRFQEDQQRRRFEHIKKPIFNLMEALSKMGDQVLKIENDVQWSDQLGVLATSKNNLQIAILVYNSADNMYHSAANHVHLKIKNIPFKKASYIHYRIDEEYSNAFMTWMLLDAPDEPKGKQFVQLQQNQELQLYEAVKPVSLIDKSFEACFDLPLPGVSLIMLSVQPDDPPKKVKNLRYEVYDGLDKNKNVLLLWDDLKTSDIKTFEVYSTDKENGHFTRVNAEDFFSNAYLSITDPGNIYFKIRAQDYWGRYGDYSDTIQIKTK